VFVADVSYLEAVISRCCVHTPSKVEDGHALEWEFTWSASERTCHHDFPGDGTKKILEVGAEAESDLLEPGPPGMPLSIRFPARLVSPHSYEHCCSFLVGSSGHRKMTAWFIVKLGILHSEFQLTLLTNHQ